MAKRKMTKGHTTIHKTLERKLMIAQHEPHIKLFCYYFEWNHHDIYVFIIMLVN